MRLHLRAKSFECKECGKHFSSAGRLRRHSTLHAEEKPFECNQCGKCFGHVGSLSLHKRVHNAEKPRTSKQDDNSCCFSISELLSGIKGIKQEH